MEDRTQVMGQGLPGVTGAYAAQPAAADPLRTAIGGPLRALEIEVAFGNRYAPATGGREHLLLRLRASSAAAGRRMPLNLCLAIDRSGSMEGPPLDCVKHACGHVIDLLEPSDVLSVVTFEEQVDVVVPARRVVNRTLLKEHINRIQPGNTTNLYDGIAAACAQVAAVNNPGYLSRVLVLTDGEPTVGIKDYATTMSLIAQQKAAGITVTALGFGSEYNEELMSGIARRSGGNYYYIQQPAQIPGVFDAELRALMTVTAKNVRVRVSTPRGAQCRYVYGAPAPRFVPRTVEYMLPDVERGSALASLSEFDLEPHVPGTYRVARVDVTYDDVVSGRTEALTADAVVDFTTEASLVESGRDPLVNQELQVHLASRNLEKTMMGMRTQQLTAMGAMGEMQRTRTILMQAGRTQQAEELTAAMTAMQTGGDVEKTLVGTVVGLEQGKTGR